MCATSYELHNHHQCGITIYHDQAYVDIFSQLSRDFIGEQIPINRQCNSIISLFFFPMMSLHYNYGWSSAFFLLYCHNMQYCIVIINELLTILTHWGRVTHICVSKLTIIGSDNGLSPGWHQAIIWTNTGVLLIRTLETNFSEILSKIHTFSFRKIYWKMPSAKWRQFYLGLNMIRWDLTALCGILYVKMAWQKPLTMIFDFPQEKKKIA